MGARRSRLIIAVYVGASESIRGYSPYGLKRGLGLPQPVQTRGSPTVSITLNLRSATDRGTKGKTGTTYIAAPRSKSRASTPSAMRRPGKARKVLTISVLGSLSGHRSQNVPSQAIRPPLPRTAAMNPNAKDLSEVAVADLS